MKILFLSLGMGCNQWMEMSPSSLRRRSGTVMGGNILGRGRVFRPASGICQRVLVNGMPIPTLLY